MDGPAPPAADRADLSRRHAVQAVVWAVLVAAVLLIGDRGGLLPNAPDAWTYDWRTSLVSKRAAQPRRDIAVLLIGEEGLGGYLSRSPVDRRLLARLLRAVDGAGARAIGLDFIFDRTQGETADKALIDALKSARAPVILGAIDGRTERVAPDHLAFQSQFIAAAEKTAGHLYFSHKRNNLTVGDQVVRYMLGPSPPPVARQSFARLLAEVDGQKPKLTSNLISWLRPPASGGADVFPTLNLRRHEPGAAIDAILPPGWQAVVKDRIVLIGGDFIDRDGHLTPFSVIDGVRMPGVMVHGQILAQIRDGRSIHEMPKWAEAAALVILALLGIWLGHIFGLRSGNLLVWLAGVAAVVLVGLAAFRTAGLILPSSTLFLAWMAGVFGNGVVAWFEDRAGGAGKI